MSHTKPCAHCGFWTESTFDGDDHSSLKDCISVLKKQIGSLQKVDEENATLAYGIGEIAEITGLGCCGLDRPTIPQLLEALVFEMKKANPYWIKKT